MRDLLGTAAIGSLLTCALVVVLLVWSRLVWPWLQRRRARRRAIDRLLADTSFRRPPRTYTSTPRSR